MINIDPDYWYWTILVSTEIDLNKLIKKYKLTQQCRKRSWF